VEEFGVYGKIDKHVKGVCCLGIETNGIYTNKKQYQLIRYPCVNCLNEKILRISKIREHLLCNGFLKTYKTWTWRGKLLDLPSARGASEKVDFSMNDRLKDMIRDVREESFANAVFETVMHIRLNKSYLGFFTIIGNLKTHKQKSNP